MYTGSGIGVPARPGETVVACWRRGSAVDERIAANRANWNARTPAHLASSFYDVEGWLAEGRGPLRDEAEALGDVTGLRLVHLQCHIGLDTLAWARAGAQVVGLDFSPVAVAAAQDLAQRAGLTERATFVCADVNDAATALQGEQFDIVYVSLGALCWLPSVARWASQVAALLEGGGRLFLYEGHPLAFALGDHDAVFEFSYFEEAEGVMFDDGAMYTDGPALVEDRQTFEWNHSIGEIVNALLNEGLILDSLIEHDWTRYRRFPWLEVDDDGRWASPTHRPRIPLSFTLQAHRP
jgi:SAM-dependent methyltransferase